MEKYKKTIYIILAILLLIAIIMMLLVHTFKHNVNIKKEVITTKIVGRGC